MSAPVTDAFRSEFRKVLLDTYTKGWQGVRDEDIADHVDGRYRQFRDHLMPWIDSVFPLAGTRWVEVGSGTGSSTLALAERGASVRTYEISAPSIAAATARLRLMGASA